MLLGDTYRYALLLLLATHAELLLALDHFYDLLVLTVFTVQSWLLRSLQVRLLRRGS